MQAVEHKVDSAERGWVIGRRSRWRDPVRSHKGGLVAVAPTLVGSGKRTYAPRSGPPPPPGPL